MSATDAPARHAVHPAAALSRLGLACHLCGGPLRPDGDPRRRGWLTCATHGPVYMPLDGRLIRVHIACSLDEAAARVARLDLQLLKGGSYATLDP